MKIDADLWQHYKQAYFFLNRELTFPEFAIITAWNPHSIKGSKKENDQRNSDLQRDFNNFNYCKMSVGDLKRAWLEESFAVEIPQILAIELGNKYDQNAIYYVRNNQLYLISCLKNNTLEKIGGFSQKVVMQKKQ
jgi:hypothetical protein